MLAAAAAAHLSWAEDVAESVMPDPADSAPHDGRRSDYGEHHADRSAPAELDDPLSRSLVGLLGEHRGEQDMAAAVARAQAAGPSPTEEAMREAAAWVPRVPNVLLDLREAKSDAPLRKYWLHGEGAAKIGWNTDGDWTRCVALLDEHVKDPKGLCAEYHKSATGRWPNQK